MNTNKGDGCQKENFLFSTEKSNFDEGSVEDNLLGATFWMSMGPEFGNSDNFYDITTKDQDKTPSIHRLEYFCLPGKKVWEDVPNYSQILFDMEMQG